MLLSIHHGMSMAPQHDLTPEIIMGSKRQIDPSELCQCAQIIYSKTTWKAVCIS
jgi:hypothetical protein